MFTDFVIYFGIRIFPDHTFAVKIQVSQAWRLNDGIPIGTQLKKSFSPAMIQSINLY